MSKETIMKKVASLMDECRKFVPLDGRVLVHALKIRQVKQSDYSFDLADTKANEGKDPKKHRVDLQKIQPKINAKYQEAIVLQVPFDENRFTVGDTVVYPMGVINPFDLVKGVSILRKYDIAAVVNYNGIEDEQTNKKVVEVPIMGSNQMAGYTSMVSRSEV
jgi:hypothetical protein